VEALSMPLVHEMLFGRNLLHDCVKWFIKPFFIMLNYMEHS